MLLNLGSRLLEDQVVSAMGMENHNLLLVNTQQFLSILSSYTVISVGLGQRFLKCERIGFIVGTVEAATKNPPV
jgi:hypothetical protein